MGSIIGKEGVAEPSFKVLLTRSSGVKTAYEIREYGNRFVAEVAYSDPNNMNSPFQTLANYIGVFGNPQNEGGESIVMTAPVVMDKNEHGTQIAMTTPVVTDQKPQGISITMTAPVTMSNDSTSGYKRMKFFLPAEYDELSKIPKPTNPAVKIAAVPPSLGAVHRYSGFYDDNSNEAQALALAAQLREDGVERINDDYAKQNYEFWGFNPPFTLPMFRRNEVWLELTPEEVGMLQGKYNSIVK